MKNFLALLLMFLCVHAQGSTFVGNGGNAGDVELLVTLRHIQDTVRTINAEKSQEEKNFCSCEPLFENHSTCRYLKDLDKKQVHFCSKVLEEKAKDMVWLLEKRDNVKFNWTHESIQVRENSRIRGADAVTNFKTSEVILNNQSFIDMKQFERIFLLSHELFHLVKLNKRPLTDEGDFGPFKGETGGRTLINALSAAIVMRSHSYHIIERYKKALRGPHGWKKHWLSLGMGSLQMEDDSETPFYMDSYSTTQFSYRYYFNNFGLFFYRIHADESKTVLNTIKAHEENTSFGAGISYRVFPFKDPLTFFGQSHLVINLAVEQLNSAYTIHDGSVGSESSAQSLGANIECKYFMPITRWFWGYVGGNLQFHNYDHDFDSQINFKYDKVRSGASIGVSYGF